MRAAIARLPFHARIVRHLPGFALVVLLGCSVECLLLGGLFLVLPVLSLGLLEIVGAERR